MLYSERINGSKPRTKEDICPSMWKGIVTILETLESQNYFAEAFPETCPDSGENCGTDSHKLNNTLNALNRFLLCHLDSKEIVPEYPE